MKPMTTLMFGRPRPLNRQLSTRRVCLTTLLVVATVLLGEIAFGQSRDFREEKTDSLTYRGVEANAQTDPANHTMNRHPSVPGWGGCVPSSVRTAALHAGVPRDRVDEFWRVAQERVGVGGTDPQLLAEMVRQAFGDDEEWISVVDTDPGVVRKALATLSAAGHQLCATMGWGELYGPRRIAHMVNVNHYSEDDDLACVEDNNDPPGVYRWMPASEYLARCMSGGQGWVFSFTRLPVVAQVALMLLLAAAILLLASSALLVGWRVLLPPR